MIDKNKKYTLEELLDIYSLYNIDFKFYGNNDKGDLEVYLKTDVDKMSVFKSMNKQTKLDYLKLSESEAKKIVFMFDREVDEMDLDIVAIVLRTSDVNIPSGKYKLDTLDRLTKEQDLEDRSNSNYEDGISYLIVDQNTSCPLYDNFYIFGKDEGGLMKCLERDLKEQTDSLLHNNLKMILDYYNNLKEEKVL